MSFCPYKSKITAYRLELLDKAEMQEIEAHARQCAECQYELKLEMTIEKTLSETMDAGEIETVVMRRVKTLKEIPFPAAIFGFGFWRIIFYTLSAIGLGYALLVYLGKIIALEGINAWLNRVADFLGSMSLTNPGLITIASMGLSVVILSFYYLYRFNPNR